MEENDDDYNYNETGPSMSYNRCQNCKRLEKMLLFRDRTMMRLIEDRDQLKIKLTKAMNQNIELSRQLMRYQNLSPPKEDKKIGTDDSFETIFLELDVLRKRCRELEDVKHNLFILQKMFSQMLRLEGNSPDLSNSSESGTISKDIINSEEDKIRKMDKSKINCDLEPLFPQTDSQVRSTRFSNRTSNFELIDGVDCSQPTDTSDKTISDFDLWYNS